METMLILIKQVAAMFLLAGVGFVLFRTKKISMEGSKAIGNILIYLALPCVIINGFLVERTPERMVGLLISAGLAAVILVLGALVARLVLGKNSVENFSASFSNPGFFGVPLIVASMSSGAVFYVAAFIALLNMGQWTYGVWLMENEDENGNLLPKEERAKRAAAKGTGSAGKALALRIIKAPFMIAILIGLVLFFTQLPLPAIVKTCLSQIGNLNTPLAMFTIGIYLAQTNIKKMFLKPRLYLVSLVKMILAPAIALGILLLLPAQMHELRTALLIAAACPVGSNVAVYAQLHNSNYTYAVETVIISTLISIVTIPAIVGIAGF